MNKEFENQLAEVTQVIMISLNYENQLLYLDKPSYWCLIQNKIRFMFILSINIAHLCLLQLKI